MSFMADCQSMVELREFHTSKNRRFLSISG